MTRTRLHVYNTLTPLQEDGKVVNWIPCQREDLY